MEDRVTLFSAKRINNMEETSLDLNRGLQFGEGIYMYLLNENSKEEILEEKEVDTYTLHLTMLKKVGGKVKVFDKPDKEWLEFIYRNLIKGENLGREYDLIMGPMFNKEYLYKLTLDNLILGTFMEGYYEKESKRTTIVTIKSRLASNYVKKSGSGVCG